MPEASANGLTLHWDSFGDGEPLVLVMGIGTQMIFWRRGFCEALAARGFRVIRFDNRDIGLSSKLESAGRPALGPAVARSLVGLSVSVPYTLSDMAADIVGLLDALELPSAHVVGTSMGGMIAQTLAIEAPSRVRTLTSLMSTPGARRFWLHRPRGLAALLTPRPADPEHAVDAAMGLFRTLHGTGMPFPEDEMRALLTEAIERSFYPQGFLRQLAAVVASGDRTRALTQVRIPTLVLHGTHDPLIPPAAGAATAAAIPGARFQLVEGMGHGMPPQAWPTLVDAIADHALGSASVR